MSLSESRGAGRKARQPVSDKRPAQHRSHPHRGWSISLRSIGSENHGTTVPTRPDNLSEILCLLPYSNGVGFALGYPHCYEGVGEI